MADTQTLAFKTRIHLSNTQRSKFRHWSNARRYAYNWALSMTNLFRDQADDDRLDISFINKVDKWFNAGKRPLHHIRKTKSEPSIGSGVHTWLTGIPGSVCQQAIKYDLKGAWVSFFKGLARPPHFQNRFRRKSFTLSVQDIKGSHIEGNYVKLPAKLGRARLGDACPNKFEKGKLKHTSFTEHGGKWYVSFCLEIPDEESYQKCEHTIDAIGVDLGVTQFASLSTGEHAPFPKEALKRVQRRIDKLRRSHKRCEKDSIKYKKTIEQIAKLMARQQHMRENAAHQLTNQLAKTAGLVILEDLDTKNLTKSAAGTIESPGTNVKAKRGLNREILNMGWHRVRSQLQYKTEKFGCLLTTVPPQYTSQECSECHYTHADNRLSQALFKCQKCGHSENADINAAKNIRQKGLKKVAGAG